MSSGGKAQPGLQGVLTSRKDFMNPRCRKHLRATGVHAQVHMHTHTTHTPCTHRLAPSKRNPGKSSSLENWESARVVPLNREEAKEQADCGHKAASVEALVRLEAAIMFWARLSV